MIIRDQEVNTYILIMSKPKNDIGILPTGPISIYRLDQIPISRLYQLRANQQRKRHFLRADTSLVNFSHVPTATTALQLCPAAPDRAPFSHQSPNGEALDSGDGDISYLGLLPTDG